MASRRASARLSGESNGGPEIEKARGNAKKRPGEEGLGAGDVIKKRAKQVKTKPAFAPKPIILPNSSDTPPDEPPINLPPPPSEKKIARRRESTRAIREQQPQSPSPPPIKRTKVNPPPPRGRSEVRMENDGLRLDLVGEASKVGETSMAPPHVDFLNFSVFQRPKPSAPRPASPPTTSTASKRMSMGPPTGYVKKTRKSLRGVLPDLSNDEVVPVAESETPMIRRNKALRKRSSMGMRGQRASSSLGRGEISMPHPSVESSTFYKHITPGPSLPEPHRARHLLVWCAKRAVDAALQPVASSSKSKAKEKERVREELRTEEGDRLVKEVMDEFMSTLGKGRIDTNVFAQVQYDAMSSAVPLRAHPRNISNREVEATIGAVVKRCKEENNQWTSLIGRANRKQVDVVDRITRKRAANAEPDTSRAEQWMKDALGLAQGILAEGEGDLSAMGEFADVEYKVDTLLQSSHRALQYSLQAQRFLDGIFSSLTSDLRSRERLGLPSTLPTTDSDQPDASTLLSTTRQKNATAGPSRSTDPMNMLRALATAEAKQQSEDTVAAAAKVAPIPAPALSMSMSVSQTPRRPVAGMTPRRAGTGTGTLGGVMGLGTTPGSRRVLGKAATPVGE